MRLKQIALATLFVAATALPALAQTPPATTLAKPAVTAPAVVAPVAPAPAMAATPATPAKPATATAAKPAPSEKPKKSTTAIVDINTATSEELQVVKGIGKATATKIIAGRPYKAIDDLDTKKVISHGEFTKLKGQFAI